MGQVHFAREEYERAAARFSEALRFYPAYPLAHLDRALAAWADASPQHTEAAEARELLASLDAAS